MKYLFTAIYGDNGELKQAENDISVVNPQKSSFYDVLERAKIQKITHFFLEGDGKTFGVNLETGQFFINGSWLSFNVQDFTGWPLRLIYFRQVDRFFNAGGLEVGEPNIVFNIGFQTNAPDGRNIKQVLRVDEHGNLDFQLE